MKFFDWFKLEELRPASEVQIWKNRAEFLYQLIDDIG